MMQTKPVRVMLILYSTGAPGRFLVSSWPVYNAGSLVAFRWDLSEDVAWKAGPRPAPTRVASVPISWAEQTAGWAAEVEAMVKGAAAPAAEAAATKEEAAAAVGASTAPPIMTSPGLWPDIEMISPEVWPDLPSVDTPAPPAGVVYVPVDTERYQQQQGAPTEDPGDEDDWDRLYSRAFSLPAKSRP